MYLVRMIRVEDGVTFVFCTKKHLKVGRERAAVNRSFNSSAMMYEWFVITDVKKLSDKVGDDIIDLINNHPWINCLHESINTH